MNSLLHVLRLVHQLKNCMYTKKTDLPVSLYHDGYRDAINDVLLILSEELSEYDEYEKR